MREFCRHFTNFYRRNAPFVGEYPYVCVVVLTVKFSVPIVLPLLKVFIILSMSQQVITSYFGKRKRIAEDYSKVKAKKILLDDVNTSSDLKCGVSRPVEENDNCENYESLKCGKTNSSLENKTSEDKYSECTENGLARDTGRAETNCQNEQKIFKTIPPVSFKLMGSLSPTKKSNSISQGAIKSDTVS